MTYLTTEEAAARLGLRPQTLRASLCKTGHYLSIRPTKLPNRLLRWPATEIDRLLSGVAISPTEQPANGDRSHQARHGMEQEENGPV